MKTLSNHDRDHLMKRVAAIEKKTGIEIVPALIGRCDPYAELPWLAFAMGTVLAGFVLLVMNLTGQGWTPIVPFIAALAIPIAAGGLFSLLAVFIPGFARRFLSSYRSEAEVRQYAEAFFLRNELFATRKRDSILVLVSLFERKIIILPDTGIQERLSPDQLNHVLRFMRPYLKNGRIREAYEAGFDQIAGLLFTKGRPDDENELFNGIIEEKGA